ncbi:MAG: nucleotide sugar dehydrogenase [Deltaproteobacteria bacterium]|nr:nucleotide sugar dehydrogenase [Deltaproteobacteria bacterium]
MQLYDVCIIGGLGHMGLPLGLSLANTGKRVLLYDIDRKAMDIVSRGRMPFMELGAEEILCKVLGKTLFLSSEKDQISSSRFIFITIGTPVDRHLNPRYNMFIEFFSGIVGLLRDGQHLILRSTVFPGTTEKIRGILEKHALKVRVSFCPERIAEGKAMEELRSLPQIIGSFDEASFDEVKELFLPFNKDVVFLTPTEAELAKLFTNSWRYIQFSIANQFYQISCQHGVDFYRIYDSITYNYPRAKGFPRAGFAAGPCLFKDTMQLAAFSNNTFFLGHAAMLINEGLPNFIVQNLKEKYSLRDKVVGILGMAFKADSDDSRESLSYKLKKILEIEAKAVYCTDPYIKDTTTLPLDQVLKLADILILGAPHAVYRDLQIDSTFKIVVDVWNFFGKGGLVW